LSTGHSEHDYCADDGEDGDEGYGEAFAGEFRGEPGAAEDGDDLDDAEGDVEENGLEVCVAEIADDEVAEGGDAAACDAVVFVRTKIPRIQ
jgi:hypothetical protein